MVVIILGVCGLKVINDNVRPEIFLNGVQSWMICSCRWVCAL